MQPLSGDPSGMELGEGHPLMTSVLLLPLVSCCHSWLTEHNRKLEGKGAHGYGADRSPSWSTQQGHQGQTADLDGRHPAQVVKVACLIRCLTWGLNGTEAGRQRWEGKAEGVWGNIQCKGPEPGACCESSKEPEDAVALTTEGRMMAGRLAFWTLSKD